MSYHDERCILLMMTRSVLIIDDEPNMRWVLGKALEQAGYTVHVAATGDEGLAAVGRAPVDLVLLDLKLKGEDGLTVLRRLRERRPELTVMLLTAYGTVANAVEAMQLGAADFLRKPFDVEEVTFKVARALERRAMQEELTRLAAHQRTPPSFEALVGVSPAWHRLLEQARIAARSNDHILLIGEQGSGRATLAWAIHGASTRVAAPFVTFDAQLFHVAVQRSRLLGTGSDGGAWGEAGSGTLFVRASDTAQDLPLALAEAIERDTSRSGPRVVLAVHDETSVPEPLGALIPIHVRIAPLRTRPGDIIALARHFAANTALTDAALSVLGHYSWPENVVELRAVITEAAHRAGGAAIDTLHLPEQVRDEVERGAATPFRLPSGGVNLEDVEQALIRQALARAHGNKSKAADLLGLTRHTLLYRMEKYGISGVDKE
jgi:DNA-binding NtrC family response regulator